VNFVSKLSVFVAVLIAVFSLEPWFVWSLFYLKVVFICLFILLRCVYTKLHVHTSFIFVLYICFIMWIYLYGYHATSIVSMFANFVNKFLPLCLVITFSRLEKKIFIRFLTNVFSVIVLCSLICFTIWFLGCSLPSSIITHPVNLFYGNFINFYTFVIVDDYGIFTRFQSVFTEPGHLGMISAILLYINKYDLNKWQVWVLIVGLLWSFSLAAYLLLFLGIMIFFVLKSSRLLMPLLRMSFVLSALILLCFYIYEYYPNSTVSTLVFSRMELDSEKGIVGNNRNDINFIRYYEDIQDKKEYLLGIGIQKYTGLFMSTANSSYKVFIMQYGLLGIGLLILFFLSLLRMYYSNLSFGLFLLLSLSFIQRPYALWEIESFAFICAISLFLKK